MNKLFLLGIVLAAGLTAQGAAAEIQWYLIPQTACGNCIPVEPYDGPLGNYQVHVLKAGETPSMLNYNCWGCTPDDFQTIWNETGLWYWPTGHN